MLCLLLVLCLAACDDMDAQPRGKPQTFSTFFANGSLARPVVAGTVARSEGDADDAYHTGFDDRGLAVERVPTPITAQLLSRGRERFNIYCIECHGQLGDGKGMVVLRGFPAPPTYHSDRLRSAPAGHLFDVITNGLGKMPPHGPQVPVPDRWAIVAYVRVLQLSQHATLQDAPPSEQQRLEAQP